jgi:SAM-dependent methyltransferase
MMDKKLSLKEITEANRLAWNEVTPVHQKARRIDYKKEFAEKGYSTLDKVITAKLKELGLVGGDVAQVCCNNGRETLSMLNSGAKSAVGFDISDDALKEAEQLNEISGLNCTFIRTDIYDIGDEYNERFDLILITIGALAWMPDFGRFFKQVSKMIKPGGHLVIYENHPFHYMFADEGEEDFDPDNPEKIVYDYFRTEPWIGTDGIDYIGRVRYKSKVNYNYSYTISALLSSVIKSGLRVAEFSEYKHNISDDYKLLEKNKNIPFCYILVAEKD